MKDALIIWVVVVVSHFLFSGEPKLYDLLHDRAIEAAHGIKGDT